MILSFSRSRPEGSVGCLRLHLGALALQVADRGAGAVVPVGVERCAAGLALHVGGGELGADRGDRVVDRDHAGARLGAGGGRRGRTRRNVVQVDHGLVRLRVVRGAARRSRAARALAGQAWRFQGAVANPAVAGFAGWAAGAGCGRGAGGCAGGCAGAGPARGPAAAARRQARSAAGT